MLGCCQISPSFLLTDIGFFMNDKASGFVRNLLASEHAEAGSDQIRVKASTGPGGHLVCRFLQPGVGCRLPMPSRPMVCRQYLCPEVGLWQDSRARRWVDFWLFVQEEEVRQQQLLADECARRGVSLLLRRDECLQLVQSMYQELQASSSFPGGYPAAETIILKKQA
jgi:hypothetical protein